MRLVLAGAIAVGKSATATVLEQRLNGARQVREPVDSLRFLPRFYDEPSRWSFHSRLELLAHKADLWARPSGDGVAIYDRGMHELVTFARVLNRRGEMATDELEVYERIYAVVVASLPPLELVVWCRCDSGECLRRIRDRGRQFEQGVSAEYLDALDAEYAGWTSGLDRRRTFVYDTTVPSADAEDVLVDWVQGHADR